jgi:uncharacterized membrane protein
VKRILGFLFSLLFFFLPTHAFAEDFVIDSFHSDINILETGVVEVRETIRVDFSANEKHGIFRDLPYAYSSDDGTYYTDISIHSVQRNGKEEKYDLSRNDSFVRLKIGDAGVTISGRQTYEITYSVTGILKGYQAYDEVYWNVTGNDWQTPIHKASASVSLPDAGLIKATCYQGYEGSTDECLISSTPQTATYTSTGSLEPSEGMTIVASYTKGMVPLLTVSPPEKFPFLKWEYFYVFLATSVIGTSLVIWHWYREGRDVWSPIPLSLSKAITGKNKPLFARDTVTVEFTPPDAMRPAELGVLVDERADTLDVTATIIDLAGRGFLKIKEIEKSWVFGKRDYELTEIQKDVSSLKNYEKTLLSHLFASGQTVRLSDLKMTFYDELKQVKDKLYDNVVKSGYFVEHPEKRKNIFLILSVVLSSVAIFLFVNLLSHYYIEAFLLGVLVSSLVLLLFSRSMSRRSIQGSDLYRRALGYRLFISGAEKYRQQFFEKKNMLNEILPYAIVFGLTEKFAKAMEQMGIKQANPSWYTGTHPFTYSTFASDMNTFSGTLSTAMQSAPSSSGSSGGSSGGGFGGGGGGSW